MNFIAMGAYFGARALDERGLKVSASECALWLCVNAYNISLRLGTQTQHFVASLADVEGSYYYPSSLSWVACTLDSTSNGP